MDEVRVRSWTELHEQVYEGSFNAEIGRFRSNFAFRGSSDASWTLSTSLSRLRGSYHEMERHLLRNFIKYAQQEVVPNDSEWYWVALAQHHGLPTRLLDWTYSPLVAMHFATHNLSLYDRDGIIWCVDYVKTNRLLPEFLREILEEEGANAFTNEMLGRVAPTLQEFDRLTEDEFVLFFEPPSFDTRIVNQFAMFSLMPNPRARLDLWLEERPELFRRIVIPAALKWEVRDKLDQANVTERVLMPGLDGLCSWLKRQYSPKERCEEELEDAELAQDGERRR
jgi:hypothetical protein